MKYLFRDNRGKLHFETKESMEAKSEAINKGLFDDLLKNLSNPAFVDEDEFNYLRVKYWESIYLKHFIFMFFKYLLIGILVIVAFPLIIIAMIPYCVFMIIVGVIASPKIQKAILWILGVLLIAFIGAIATESITYAVDHKVSLWQALIITSKSFL